jgi:serine/threonine-protein kinase
MLRISDGDRLERKRFEYRLMERVAEVGIAMTKPLEFGTCCDGRNVYTLLTWVPGTEARDALAGFTEREQYSFGFQAGTALSRIHSLGGDLDGKSWEEHYRAKIDRVVDWYSGCRVKLPYGESVINYVHRMASHLKDRPIALQHGDFHTGSLVITPDHRVGVIDFNRCSCGDPWEEYDRYVFTWRDSVHFATGQIEAYFEGSVPDDFFVLMSLYNAVNMLASIPWAVPFGDADVKVMLENADLVWGSYDQFRSVVPRWYRESRRE